MDQLGEEKSSKTSWLAHALFLIISLPFLFSFFCSLLSLPLSLSAVFHCFRVFILVRNSFLFLPSFLAAVSFWTAPLFLPAPSYSSLLLTIHDGVLRLLCTGRKFARKDGDGLLLKRERRQE